MLTLFTIPRPFIGYFDVIQRNAIQSWLLLHPKCEVILFGDEEGVAEVAAEFNIRHIPEIERNKYGTILMSSVFSLAQKLANNHLMVYLNSDIILLNDFIKAIKRVEKEKSWFSVVGQRRDLDIKEKLQFSDPNWEVKLSVRVAKEGKMHGQAGTDYFVFPRGLLDNVPPFAVGRPVYDNWLIYKAHSLGVSVIDATEVITAIHQNHCYFRSIKDLRSGPEAQENLILAGGESHLFTLEDVNWVLTKQGLFKKPTPTIIRRFFERLVARLKTYLATFLRDLNKKYGSKK